VRAQLESWLDDWEKNDQDEDDEEAAKGGLPERKKKKLLDAKTWERDARLVDTATALRREIGGDVFCNDWRGSFHAPTHGALQCL
jgi:type I restriction enzyme M protein